MARYQDLVAEALAHVEELFPWDLAELLENSPAPLVLDVREPYEFHAMHIAGVKNIPRGILEAACEYGYEDTDPTLAAARERDIVVVCRSGKRSALAARTMQRLGYQQVRSLKTGLKGWNDYEQPLIDSSGRPVSTDQADAIFAVGPSPEQQGPR